MIENGTKIPQPWRLQCIEYGATTMQPRPQQQHSCRVAVTSFQYRLGLRQEVHLDYTNILCKYLVVYDVTVVLELRWRRRCLGQVVHAADVTEQWLIPTWAKQHMFSGLP